MTAGRVPPGSPGVSQQITCPLAPAPGKCVPVMSLQLRAPAGVKPGKLNEARSVWHTVGAPQMLARELSAILAHSTHFGSYRSPFQNRRR